VLCRSLRAGASRRAAHPTRRSLASRPFIRDAGLTLVEILISIVLLGTAASAGLVTLRTSIMASATNRDHSNAHAWLQTATDVLYGASREDCGTTTSSQVSAVRAAYQGVVRDTSNPQDWPATNISVTSVLFWDGESTYQSVCYDDFGINLQLITIQVTNPDGEIVESVQIVKG
jgi:prepilin-type N-terminal cleavage/methylation domain-containing protein